MSINLQNITGLKNVGLLLVLLGHSMAVYSPGWSYTAIIKSPIMEGFVSYIYSFHMPLFVFISGYLYGYGKFGLGKYNDVVLFIKNKSKRLLIPYIAIAMFYVIPIQIVIDYYHNLSIFSIIFKGFILSRGSDHLWFLLMLFNVFATFSMIYKFIFKYKFYVIIIVFFIIHCIGYILPSIFQIHTLCLYLIYFYIGFMFFQKRNKIEFFVTKKFGLSCFGTHLTLWFFSYYLKGEGYKKIFLLKSMIIIGDFIIALIGITFTYILVTLYFQRNNRLSNSRLYYYLDRYNFPIYLFHHTIIYVILSNFSQTTINPIILVNICFWSSLLVSILLSRLLEKNKYTKIAIGL